MRATESSPAVLPPPPAVPRWMRTAGALALPLAVAWASGNQPAPLRMPEIAMAEFAAAKLLSLEGALAPSIERGLGYLFLWPGMDARAFFAPAKALAPPRAAWVAACGQGLLGIALVAIAVLNVTTLPALWAGWLGMLGVIFGLHFGLLAVASCLWRRAGVQAAPIMRAPLLATSLAELWGGRWNLAFADLARRFVFRPVARRGGVGAASMAVFLVSGLIHESVITLPAGAGFGRPTAYFLLQGVGVLAEKSRAGKAMGLGHGPAGRMWAIAIALLPLPLAFPPAFAVRVIAPVIVHLHALLP